LVVYPVVRRIWLTRCCERLNSIIRHDLDQSVQQAFFVQLNAKNFHLDGALRLAKVMLSVENPPLAHSRLKLVGCYNKQACRSRISIHHQWIGRKKRLRMLTLFL